MKHADNERLETAELMAKDFLTLHRECSYDNKTDEERDNMERIAKLARIVTCYDCGYNKEDDINPFAPGC